MKKFFNVAFCLCTAVFVSACTPIDYALQAPDMLIGLVEGQQVCKPDEMRAINRNLMAKNTVKIGEHQSYITANDFLGAPDRTATFHLENGDSMEALFYKTASSTCNTYVLAKYNYFPIFTVDEHVVGMGHDFYEKGVKPFLSHGRARIKVLALNTY